MELITNLTQSLGGFEFREDSQSGKGQYSMDGGSTWQNFSNGYEWLPDMNDLTYTPLTPYANRATDQTGGYNNYSDGYCYINARFTCNFSTIATGNWIFNSPMSYNPNTKRNIYCKDLTTNTEISAYFTTDGGIQFNSAVLGHQYEIKGRV